jgi:hypothetical protein
MASSTWPRRVGRALLFLVAAVTMVVVGRAVWAPLRQPREHVRAGTAQGRLAAAVLGAAVGADGGAAAAGRLAEAVRLPTISYEDRTRVNGTALLALHALLRRHFPQTHARLKVEAVNTYSLLFTWAGRVPSLPGVVLAAHLDVVPVDPATATLWTHPPFSGAIADGYIWGRGTLDDKVRALPPCPRHHRRPCMTRPGARGQFAVWAVMEATERLLLEGWAPERTVYYAFGHDEEIGGGHGSRRASTGPRLGTRTHPRRPSLSPAPPGAQAIAALFMARGVDVDLLLDEGAQRPGGGGGGRLPPSWLTAAPWRRSGVPIVHDDVFPGMRRPLAAVGLSEKGHVDIMLT